MPVRIGYQGIAGSYSETAARKLAEQSNLPDAALHPLISSRNVVAALRSGQIDYGVHAIRNSTAGPVSETAEALSIGSFETISTVVLPIHHCVFVKNARVTRDLVKEVRSHEQALQQCRANLAALFPNAKLTPIEDTAIGALRLAGNEYPDHIAVVCSRETGDGLGLYLIQASVQDAPDNRTEFIMVKRISQEA